MPLSESMTRLAIYAWAVLWLPGLALACWRTEQLLRTGHLARSIAETLALLAIPVLSYGAYALSDAQRYAQAHHAHLAWSALLPLAQVALPYAVGTLYLVMLRRRSPDSSAPSHWWIALILGLSAVLVFAPSLILSQLMVLAGT